MDAFRFGPEAALSVSLLQLNGDQKLLDPRFVCSKRIAVKVLHLIPSIAPCRGGPSTAVFDMVKALRQRGIDAAIVSTDDDGPRRLRQPLDRWFELEGVPVRLFQRWSPPIAPLRDFSVSPALAAWLSSSLKSWDVMHVHALFCYPTTWGMAIARRLGTPYVLHSIGQLQQWGLQRSAWRKKLMFRLIENANLRGASLLQATSPLEAHDIARLGLNSRIRVIPLGVPSQPPPSHPPQPGQLLFLSRLHHKKRLEILLQALALVRRLQPCLSWSLTIAGSGDPAYQARLQQLSQKLGLEPYCHWAGFVSGRDKLELLQTSDWFVLPSAAENFAIAAAESLAAGTPVILSPEVGIAEDVERAGAGLICPGEPNALAHTLIRALQSSNQAYRVAALNLAHERYSWPITAAELEDVYSRLISNPRSGEASLA